LNEDFSLMNSLRRVFEAIASGQGVSRSMLRELGGQRRYSGARRMLLLGHSLESAVGELVKGSSKEVGVLGSLLMEARKSSASVVGRSSESVSNTVEKWAKLRENRRLEAQSQQFRGVLASGVMGAVTSMVCTLGPLLGSFGLMGQHTVSGDPWLPVTGGCLALMGSTMLGLSLSGGRFYRSPAVCMALFFLVRFAVGPLAQAG